MSRLGVAVALSAVAHAGVAAAVLASRSAEPWPVLSVDLTQEASPRAAAGVSPVAPGGRRMPERRERLSAVGRSSPSPAEAPVATPAPESPVHGAPSPAPVVPAPSAPAVAPSTEAPAREPPPVAEVLPTRAPEAAAPETWSDGRAMTRAPEALAHEPEAPPPPGGSGGDSSSTARPAPAGTGAGASGAEGDAARPAAVAGHGPSASREAGGGSGTGRPAGAAEAAGATAAPAGQTLGRATPPGAGGEASARYGAYLERWRERIQAALRYPPAARRRGLAGTVHLEVTLDPAGRVREARVVRSAHPLLDEAALESVRGLGPEPFPPDLPPRLLRVRLPVVFALE